MAFQAPNALNDKSPQLFRLGASVWLSSQLATCSYPKNDTGYKKVDADKFNYQVKKIEPKATNKCDRKNRQNGHNGETTYRIKSIEVTLSNKPRQEEHSDIYYN